MAHTIMGTKKCYYLSSESWRPRKIGGVIQSESEGPRIRSTDVCRQEKTGVPAEEESDNSPCLCLPVLSGL